MKDFNELNIRDAFSILDGDCSGGGLLMACAAEKNEKIKKTTPCRISHSCFSILPGFSLRDPGPDLKQLLPLLRGRVEGPEPGGGEIHNEDLFPGRVKVREMLERDIFPRNGE